MTKIAIINLKGGVGKSVTTINLAAELAAAGDSVLVLDLDKQANTTKYYNRLDYAAPSMADVLTRWCSIDEATVETPDPGIALVPANMQLLAANRTVMLDVLDPQQSRLREALAGPGGAEARAYTWCLMDCPPDLDMGSINALCAADYVLVPVDCDEWGLDGLQEILDQLDHVMAHYNPTLQLMGVLLTKWQRTRHCVEIARRLPQYAVPVFDTAIRYTVAVKNAKAAHKPLRTFAPESTAAADYCAIAAQIRCFNLPQLPHCVQSGHATEQEAPHEQQI